MSSEAYYRIYSDSVNKVKKIGKLMFDEEKPIIKCGSRYYSEHFNDDDKINIPRHLFVGSTYLVKVYKYGWEDFRTILYQDGVVLNSIHDYDERFLENKTHTTYFDVAMSILKRRLKEEAYSTLLTIKESNLYQDIIIRICSEKTTAQIIDTINENYQYLRISKNLTVELFIGIYFTGGINE